MHMQLRVSKIELSKSYYLNTIHTHTHTHTHTHSLTTHTHTHMLKVLYPSLHVDGLLLQMVSLPGHVSGHSCITLLLPQGGYFTLQLGIGSLREEEGSDNGPFPAMMSWGGGGGGSRHPLNGDNT